jgi:hypothetical protein
MNVSKIQLPGEIISRNISSASMTLNYYFHQECIWLLDSKVERQLRVELATHQNRESIIKKAM